MNLYCLIEDAGEVFAACDATDKAQNIRKNGSLAI